MYDGAVIREATDDQ